MIALRNIKSFHEILTGLNFSGFSSNVFVKNFCNNLEQNRKTLFFNDDVQSLLKSLTRVDYEKLFRPRKLGNTVSTPKLKFMTDEELEKANEEVKIKALQKLQMPPVLPPRKEIDHVYVKDRNLEYFSESKYVFTDITYGKNDRTRHIVVRDVDGTLRKATWREREMCNEIYFPVKGRKLRIPKMFIPEYFEGFPLTQVTGSTLVKEVLNKGWFQFILERACIQFEPDDPFYISVTQRTFDKIAEGKGFQEFESSRFFGPMIYYFTEKQKLAPVIVYFLNYNRMEDILALIKLHNILQPDRVCSVPNQPGRELTLLRAFVAEQYPHDSQLELALKSYEDYISKPKAQAAI